MTSLFKNQSPLTLTQKIKHQLSRICLIWLTGFASFLAFLGFMLLFAA